MTQNKKKSWAKTIAKSAAIIGASLGLLYIIGKIKNEKNTKHH